MCIKQVLEHAGFEVKTILLMDSSAARGICRREEVGRVRHLSAKTLWLQKAVKHGLITDDSVAGNDDKADFGTKSLSRQRLVILRRSSGLEVHDGEGEDEEGQDDEGVLAMRLEELVSVGSCCRL